MKADPKKKKAKPTPVSGSTPCTMQAVFLPDLAKAKATGKPIAIVILP